MSNVILVINTFVYTSTTQHIMHVLRHRTNSEFYNWSTHPFHSHR